MDVIISFRKVTFRVDFSSSNTESVNGIKTWHILKEATQFQTKVGKKSSSFFHNNFFALMCILCFYFVLLCSNRACQDCSVSQLDSEAQFTVSLHLLYLFWGNVQGHIMTSLLWFLNLLTNSLESTYHNNIFMQPWNNHSNHLYLGQQMRKIWKNWW